MSVLFLAIGLTEAQRFFAPQPLAPAQQTGPALRGAPLLQAPSMQYTAPMQMSVAQPMYAAPMAVAETSEPGSSFLSACAFVAGLSVGLAGVAHFAQKKNPEAAAKEARAKVAALAITGKEWDGQTPYHEHIFTNLDEADVEKKIAMLAVSAGDYVPDMQRRTILNLILLGGAALPVGWMAGAFIYFFVPPSGGGGGAGLVARDALGDEVTTAKWKGSHQPLDRALVQGLKGDAHYLIVEADGNIRNYALNAVCTHLGCVVPWNRAANKFMCPCHGSQYDETGKVVRGPAPLSLALAHLDVDATDKVVLSPWTETDFRTNTPPWWKP
jgi:cytochrome b6-f complex iron-sulfur subunit